jgi:hypothetical protein
MRSWMELKRRRRWSELGKTISGAGPGVDTRSRFSNKANMSKHESSGPQPSREETDVDLEPIRKVYNAATNVLKLGKRWLKPQTMMDGWVGKHPFDCAISMYTTFYSTFASELLPFHTCYLMSESTQKLISTNQPLFDAFDFLLHTTNEIVTANMSSIGTMAAGIKKLEIARDILGEVLDDLEADETPTVRPVWDREPKQLLYGKVLCRQFDREAGAKFEILDAFETRGWPPSAPSPWRNEKKLRDTVRNLTKELADESPIRFEVRNMKPAWFRFRHRSGSHQLR